MSPSLVLYLTLVSLLGVNSQATVKDDTQLTAGRFVRCSFIRNALKNGRVKVRSRGRIAKFQCNPGFELVGKRFATCLLGKWDNPVPYCVAKGCPYREAPLNGNVLQLYGGAVLLYTCMPGYVLKGSVSAHCDGRKWNETAPACQRATNEPALNCDFETPDICGWSHDPSHDFDWKRHQFGTPSGHVGTGPSFDHTLGKGQGGFYMYTEASAPRKENDTARLFSPVYSPNHAPGCFLFWYHMYGVTVGIMRVYLKQEGQVFQELTPVWTLAGDQGNLWHRSNISLPPMHTNFQIVVEGLRGSNYVGDSAIDDVSLRQTNCTSLEDTNATDSCISRCGVSDLDTPCGCDANCEMNNTCCHDYWITCSDTGNTSVTKGIPESENDEDNNIQVNVTSTTTEIESAETTELLNTTLSPLSVGTTDQLNITTEIPSVPTLFPETPNATTNYVTSMSTDGRTEIVLSEETTKSTDESSILTGFSEIEAIVTTAILDETTSETAETFSTNATAIIKIEMESTTGIMNRTTESTLGASENQTEAVPTTFLTTEVELNSEQEEEEDVDETTNQELTETDEQLMVTHGLPVTSQTTEQVTTYTTMSEPLQNTVTIEDIPEDKPATEQSTANTMIQLSSTRVTEIKNSFESTIEDDTELATMPFYDVSDTISSPEFTDFPTETVYEDQTFQDYQDLTDPIVTPAKLDVGPTLVDPKTGFSNQQTPSSKLENKNYLALGVGSAVGVLAIGLLVGVGLYVVVNRKKKKKQHGLADDSEMRYLPQSEIVEMINSSDA